MRFPWQSKETEAHKATTPAHMFIYEFDTTHKIKVHDSVGQVLSNPLTAVKGQFPPYRCNKEHSIIITDRDGTVLAKRGPCLPVGVP